MKVNLQKLARPALVLAVALCSLGGSEASAGVNLNMSVNLGPPPVVVAAPPEVVLIPNYGVYFVPGVSFDIFFYNGYWWSPRGDRWYRASGYDGPWRVVQRRYVPGPVRHVPGDYRRMYAGERHIPYGQWKHGHGRHGGGGGHGGGHREGEDRGGGHGEYRGEDGHGEGHGGGHGRH